MDACALMDRGFHGKPELGQVQASASHRNSAFRNLPGARPPPPAALAARHVPVRRRLCQSLGLRGHEDPALPVTLLHRRATIWTHRVHFLEERALPHWAAFTIWNAGKQGRRLYRSLTAANRRKVVAFCDVDENKIRKGFYCHEDSQVCGAARHHPRGGRLTTAVTLGRIHLRRGVVGTGGPALNSHRSLTDGNSYSKERPKPRIPILHFRAARPPFIICVKLVSVGPLAAGFGFCHMDTHPAMQ
ncbi:hypothetical protein P7K49_012235 [Saguinus oedipus]|uniref:UDP-GlcNAc:betaGal beta-1,3-N-acetylglucosaminyltransferase-like protein 1 n=1 Tax=Saguinus oedipus TaxID=9490 RepID=A0ABQ9VSY7_SAGOE|nr:hypothetical protein P7K49_012235 [Saguinus oedipus]